MVIVSNGFSKFFLSVAAAEADRRRFLSSFLTGAYPTPIVRKVLALPFLRTNRKAKRLAARCEEITDDKIHAFFFPEALHVLGAMLHSSYIDLKSFQSYGRWAVRHVERAAAQGARIYHYRAGFGGASIDVARRLGLHLLCDHSIAHPSMVDTLVGNIGRIPAAPNTTDTGPFWSYVLRDIEAADTVLVNSHFVEDTFRQVGQECPPVRVIYWGIDDSFLAHVPERENTEGRLRLLFAGSFERRKGAELLIDALERLTDSSWQLEIAGPMNAALLERSRNFFSRPNVRYLGLLSRGDLAQAMARADVFVFPSLAEGSARVVFEALACGCYVITTPNAGSIVEQGIHGSIVPSGDSASLAEAVDYASDHRDTISTVGRSNASLVKTRYTQLEYGNQLMALYKELIHET